MGDFMQATPVLTTPLFTTERLLVRQIDHADIDDMFAVYGDAESMRWVGDGVPLPRDGCAHWVDVTRTNYEKRGYGMSALVLKTTGEVVGFCGLVHPGGQAEPEIKYALKRAFFGQGFASEAVIGMLRYGRETLGLRHIIATVAPENTVSLRVLQKAGMVEVSRSADSVLLHQPDKMAEHF